MPEPQQRAQRGRQPLSRLRDQPPGLRGQESRDVGGRKPAQLRGTRSGMVSHERADEIEVTAGHLGLHATLGQQITAVLLQQHLCRCRRRCALGLRGQAQPPKVAQ